MTWHSRRCHSILNLLYFITSFRRSSLIFFVLILPNFIMASDHKGALTRGLPTSLKGGLFPRG